MRFTTLTRYIVLSLGLVVSCVVSADRLDDLIAAEMKRQNIPGLAVAVVKDGRIVKERGFGVANLEHGIPASSTTMFQSASIGKQFTAALVMLLVEDRKIKLDDRVVSYLPDAPAQWSGITIRHLLNHTSGLPRNDSSIDLRRDYSDTELLTSMSKLSLLFTPGEKWSYSNLGYQVLGMLCTTVSGRFYGAQLRERIFVPAGMDASVINDRRLVPRRASGYEWKDGAMINEDWVSPSLNATGDGGMYVSARDLARWSLALDGEMPLSTSIKGASWTPAVLDDGSTADYGFGWELRSMSGHRALLHGGAWQGFTSHIVRYPDDKLTVVVLANRSRSRPDFVAERIVGFYIPDLRVDSPRSNTFDSVPAYVRGSMNGWQARDRLVRSAQGIYEAHVDLHAGRNVLRIASADWTAIDLGAPFDGASMSTEKSTVVEFRGDNLVLDVPQAATYLFRLDVRASNRHHLTVMPESPD